MGEYRTERDNGRYVVYWRRTPGTHLWLEIGEATSAEAAEAVIERHKEQTDDS
jgi:hypothetical protein